MARPRDGRKPQRGQKSALTVKCKVCGWHTNVVPRAGLTSIKCGGRGCGARIQVQQKPPQKKK